MIHSALLTNAQPGQTVDFLPQFVRCFVERILSPEARAAQTESDEKYKLREAEEKALLKKRSPMQKHCDALGYHGRTLTFDCETTTTPDQSLLFGIYTIHGLDDSTKKALYRQEHLTREALDSLAESGLFYNPETITKSQLRQITKYCEKNGYHLMIAQEFVKNIFYPMAYENEEAIIGHNLRFDLSRLATKWGEARTNFKGGFTLKLCDCQTGKYSGCPTHPSLRIKSLGASKTLFDFHASLDYSDVNKGKAKKPKTIKKNNIKFIDTMTLGKALLGAACSAGLKAMGEKFQADVIKSDADQHGDINEKYLRYCLNDVHATHALYRKQRDLYLRYGLNRPMWRITSEASLGKAHLEVISTPRFMNQHSNITGQMISPFLQAYYGGRAGVHWRNELQECIYADFKSQYPSVNAVQDLQSILLAEKIELVNNIDEVIALIDSITLDDLQNQATWKKLTSIVEVMPEGDILPIRTTYDDVNTNIGINHVYSPMPTWYTLADVIVSKLLTGKTPKIKGVLSIVATGRVKTNPIKLFGREDFVIDLNKEDFFKRVIDLRTEVKYKRDQQQPESSEYEFLDSLQNGLKILANSTAYGVLVELMQSNHTTPVHGVAYIDGVKPIKSNKLEKPGKYFCPLVGSFITAGGRLLLGIAEKLAIERGINVLMTDTDSMIFGRPEGIPREVFRQHVKDICCWFQPLSPYHDGGVFFELEDVNFKEGGELHPLFFAGVSSKRYALANIDHHPERKKTSKADIRSLEEIQHEITIRVFKEHGIHSDAPVEYIGDLHDSTEPEFEKYRNKWLRDAWFNHIYQLRFGVAAPDKSLRGRIDFYNEHPKRDQYTLSTWHLLETFGKFDGARPFSFFDVYPAINDYGKDILASDDPKAVKRPTFYAPIKTKLDYEKRTYTLIRSDLHEPVEIPLERLNLIFDRIELYFEHGEAKSYPSKGIGKLHRRHIQVVELLYIGKEYSETLGASGVLKESKNGTDYALGMFHKNQASGMFRGLWSHDLIQVAEEIGVPVKSLLRMLDGDTGISDGKWRERIEAQVEVERQASATRHQQRAAEYEASQQKKALSIKADDAQESESGEKRARQKRAVCDVSEDVKQGLQNKSIADFARLAKVSDQTLIDARNGKLVSEAIAYRIRSNVKTPARFSIREDLEKARRYFTLKAIADEAKVGLNLLYKVIRGVILNERTSYRILGAIDELRTRPF